MTSVLRAAGRWLLYFDLDGTIMCGVDDVRPRVLEALNALKQRGHKLILATGRAPASIPKAYLEIADGAITLTGALCTMGGETLLEKALSSSAAISIAEACQAAGLPIFFEDKRQFCAFGEPEWFEGNDAEFRAGATLLLRNTEELKQAWEEGVLRVQKACMDAARFRQLSASGFRLPAQAAAFSAGSCVDIVPASANKGTAARLVRKKLGWPRGRTICFGDSSNDLDLFNACAVSVSVGEKSQELAGAAGFITGTAEMDGVVSALEAMGFLPEEQGGGPYCSPPNR